jgi:LSD1 subclass zinc finger protein
MSETLKCPSCGAPLEYEPGKLTITCTYCHNNVIVPEALRPQAAISPADASFLQGNQLSRLQEIARLARNGQETEAGKLFQDTFGAGPKESREAVEAMAAGRPVSMAQVSSVAAAGALSRGLSTGCAWLVGLFIVASIVTPLAAMFGGAAYFSEIILPLIQGQVEQAQVISIAPTLAPTLTPPPTPGFAGVTLTIGSEGTGPAHFTDARTIALDGQGNIYVGEYAGARIQVFNPQGQFITQWIADDQYPIRDLAADRNGVVYAVHTGKIWRFQGNTGQLLTPPAFEGKEWFDAVTVTPNGSLLALQPGSGQGDTLLALDPAGQVTQIIEKPLNRGAARPESAVEKMAVDGQGNIYILGRNTDAVYKLSPGGDFVDRFGSRGDGPGQFRVPTDIAVDGQGRVYVADVSKGVVVFSPEGDFVAEIPVEGAGAASGLVFNDHNELFMVARDKVFKFALTEQLSK